MELTFCLVEWKVKKENYWTFQSVGVQVLQKMPFSLSNFLLVLCLIRFRELGLGYVYMVEELGEIWINCACFVFFVGDWDWDWDWIWGSSWL